MPKSETGTITLRYESPKVRVLALKVKGAILIDSMRTRFEGFDAAWEDNFWDE